LELEANFITQGIEAYWQLYTVVMFDNKLLLMIYHNPLSDDLMCFMINRFSKIPQKIEGSDI